MHRARNPLRQRRCHTVRTDVLRRDTPGRINLASSDTMRATVLALTLALCIPGESGEAQQRNLNARLTVGLSQAAPGDCKRRNLDVVLRTAGGILGAWAGGMGAWSVIDDPEAPDRKVKGDAGYQPNANTAYALGSWIGSTAGVYGVGRLLTPGCGSLGRTAIGTGAVSLILLLGREEPYLPLLGVVIGAPLQAIGGALMFNP